MMNVMIIDNMLLTLCHLKHISHVGVHVQNNNNLFNVSITHPIKLYILYNKCSFNNNIHSEFDWNCIVFTFIYI